MRRHHLLLLLLLLLPAAAGAQDAPFRGEEHRIKRIEFRGARITDAVRLIAEISGLNVVATEEAGKATVTLYLQGLTAGNAVETICKVAGLWYRRDADTQTFRVMSTKEFQKDHIVYRKNETRVFTLLHPNAIVIGQAIEDLFGDRVELSLGVEEEEALDLPGGFGLGTGVGTGSIGTGLLGTTGGTPEQRRREQDRYFRRSYERGEYGGRSESRVEAELTPDQIARLQESGAAEVTGDLLRGVDAGDPTIYVTVNRQHNLVVVRTSDDLAMKEISQLIVELDRPTPQVLLEMKILELQVGEGFQSIFDIQVTDGPSSSGPEDSQPANPLLPSALTAPRNVLGSGNFAVEPGTFVYQFLNDTVRARLQLLATERRVNTLATPLLLASNNRPARLFVGEERVLTTGVSTDVITPSDGATTTTIDPETEVRDIGNSLLITPKINADRTVTLFLVHDSSSVSPDSATIPVATADGGVVPFPVDTVNTANVQATVVAKDGMTLAVGGLIRIELTDHEQKVPVLGDIPIIRFFFRKKVTDKSKAELILLITPRVLFTPAEADAVTRERVKALSSHPYRDAGDAAYESAVRKLEKDNERETKGKGSGEGEEKR